MKNEVIVAQVRNETVELRNLLEEVYRYECQEIHNIPTGSSERRPEQYIDGKVLDFSKLQTRGRKLIIVYYYGHGAVEESVHCPGGLLISGYVFYYTVTAIELSTGRSGLAQGISWTGTQRHLESGIDIDVLLIMDCLFCRTGHQSSSDKIIGSACCNK